MLQLKDCRTVQGTDGDDGEVLDGGDLGGRIDGTRGYSFLSFQWVCISVSTKNVINLKQNKTKKYWVD